MDELRQANQELHDEIDQLAQSNRDYERRTYNLERDIVLREERIRYLEEELANAIELSIQEREELEKELSDLKKIVYYLKREIEQKDKELITRENQLAEFDVREKKLKTRIREISKSAGNTRKAYNQTVKLIDENERLKREIDTLKYNLRDRDNKLAQKKTRITDLHCQNFALALLRYRDRVELINTQETLQNAQIWNLENEYESDENSQDSYTSDPDMATITELADTIDGYLDNPGTSRVILSNQIKRATRQIRRKYNNLQTDLINEQQQRYNAEAERDICQTELTQTQGDINLITTAYNNERVVRQQYFLELQQCCIRIDTLENDLHLCDIQIDLKWGKWKNRTRNAEQLILNLQGQILLLQNNPQNMAEGRRRPVLKLIYQSFQPIPQYIGQMPPDDYINTLEQAWSIAPQMTALENDNAGDFNDAVKCDVLKSKIGGKFAPVPADDPFIQGNPAINTPATLRAYLNAKYQRETIGSQQSAIQKLTQEKFQINDTPDIYETRIRPLLLGTADNDEQVLGFLKNQLPGELYTWMKIANPGGINAFFTALKNMWLERTPNLNEAKVYQQSSYNPKIIETPVISQTPDIQKMINEALAKQKSESDAEIEKLRKEVQSQKAQKTQAPVEPVIVRQPRGPPSNLKTEKDYENYYVAKYFNDLGIYSKEDLDSNYPEKPFQRPRPHQKDNSRLEEKVDEIGHMLSHLNINNQSKKPIAKSNRTQRYYPFRPINYSFSANNENSGYNEENGIWYDDDSEKKNEYQ